MAFDCSHTGIEVNGTTKQPINWLKYKKRVKIAPLLIHIILLVENKHHKPH